MGSRSLQRWLWAVRCASQAALTLSTSVSVTWPCYLVKGTIVTVFHRVHFADSVCLVNTYYYRSFMCSDWQKCVFGFANWYLIFIQCPFKFPLHLFSFLYSISMAKRYIGFVWGEWLYEMDRILRFNIGRKRNTARELGPINSQYSTSFSFCLLSLACATLIRMIACHQEAWLGKLGTEEEGRKRELSEAFWDGEERKDGKAACNGELLSVGSPQSHNKCTGH